MREATPICDPVSLSILSTVVGGVGAAANAFGAMNAQKKQKQAVQEWAQRQNANREAEKLRQEAFREKATAAQEKGLADISAENQKKLQAEEEQRQSQYLSGQGTADTEEIPPPVSSADASIAAGTTGGSTPQTDIAKKINEATADARGRINALAAVSSYGGSSGGLGTVAPMALQEAGRGIDVQNEFRRGSLAAYGTEQNVEPVQYSYTPSPLADIFSSALSLGAQGLGSAAGQSVFGNFPSAPIGKSFIGPAKPLPTYLQSPYSQNIF